MRIFQSFWFANAMGVLLINGTENGVDPKNRKFPPAAELQLLIRWSPAGFLASYFLP